MGLGCTRGTDRDRSPPDRVRSWSDVWCGSRGNLVGSTVHRRALSVVATAVVTAVTATSCAFVSSIPDATPGAQDRRTCAVAAMVSCALPYPSDEFTVADPGLRDRPTREHAGTSCCPARCCAALGPGAARGGRVRRSGRFSALTPIMFELDRAASARRRSRRTAATSSPCSTWPPGDRVPIRVEVPAEAVRHGAPDTMVVAWPTTRYEYGHTYVARLTDGARARSAELERAPGLVDDADPDGVRACEPRSSEVEPGGWGHVLSATRFTVRSAGNSSAELDGMNSVIRSQDHPVRGLSIAPSWLVPNGSAVVTGEVAVSDFRDEHGIARVANGSHTTWVRFTLVLPATSAGPDGAPVVIYGHGLLVAKETMLATADTNAAAGFATIGIDVPNHGDRQGGDNGGYLLDLTNSRDFGRLASMPLQGIVDQVSLLLAVQQHLGGDLGLVLPDLPGRIGVPAPRLDVGRIFYEGTSMGGVLGAAFTALAPELDGSFLQVAGTGIADTIFHSLFWVLFMGIVPEGATTGDSYALMGAATMLADPADNVNVIDRIRTHGTPTFLVYGVGDGIVPNYVSDRMITLLDLPLVGRQLTPISLPHRTVGDRIPADGWGVEQVWPDAAPDTQSFLAHLTFIQASVRRCVVGVVARATRRRRSDRRLSRSEAGARGRPGPDAHGGRFGRADRTALACGRDPPRCRSVSPASRPGRPLFADLSFTISTRTAWASSGSTAAASRRCSASSPAPSIPRPARCAAVAACASRCSTRTRADRRHRPRGRRRRLRGRGVGGGGGRGPPGPGPLMDQRRRRALGRPGQAGRAGPCARRRDRPADPRRADQPPRHRRDRLARGPPRGVPRRARARHPRPALPRPGHHPRARARPRQVLRARGRLRRLPRGPRRCARSTRSRPSRPARTSPAPSWPGCVVARRRARRSRRRASSRAHRDRRRPGRGRGPLAATCRCTSAPRAWATRWSSCTTSAHGFDDGAPLFEHVELLLDNRERLGIVGANGTGKSTLLDIIAGRIEPSRRAGRGRVDRPARLLRPARPRRSTRPSGCATPSPAASREADWTDRP